MDFGAPLRSIVTAVTIVAVLSGCDADDDRYHNAPPDQPKPIVLTTPPPKAEPAAPAPSPAAPSAPAPAAPAASQMSATGAPSRFAVTSALHGLDVTHLGLAVAAPSERWALRVTGAGAPLLYFWAESRKPPALELLGASWLNAGPGGGRVFALSPPGWRALHSTAALEVATLQSGASVVLKARAVPHLLGDALSFADERRFRLDGLVNTRRYSVSSRVLPGQTGAPVLLVLAEGPVQRSNPPATSSLGPPRQALLFPGERLDLWGAAGFDAVMPTWPGGEPHGVELSVTPVAAPVDDGIVRGTLPPTTPGPAYGGYRANPMPPPSSSGGPPADTADGPPSSSPGHDLFGGARENPNRVRNEGLQLLMVHKWDEAAERFRRCLALVPGDATCEEGLSRAENRRMH